MKSNTLRTYTFWILSALAIGTLSGLLSRAGMERFSAQAIQPSLSPPAVLFPVVWTILYTLMGISATRISMASSDSATRKGLNLYVAQLIVNFFWSLIFFNARAYGFSLLWLMLLWVLTFLMILQFLKTDATAAWLQIPYLLWLSFALFLNYQVWKLNR